jgi:hypothetical protein
MTLELVTVDEAREQIRGDSADNAWLTIWVPAITEAVRSWLKNDDRLYVPMRDEDGEVIIDSSGEPIPEIDSNGPIVNPLVKAAILVELASQYRCREGEADNAVSPDNGQYGYVLCAAATSLLRALRKPTVA